MRDVSLRATQKRLEDIGHDLQAKDLEGQEQVRSSMCVLSYKGSLCCIVMDRLQ